jgi:hypothetical protein
VVGTAAVGTAALATVARPMGVASIRRPARAAGDE